MEQKSATVFAQKCSRITRNPFFNFLRCFRSHPENQNKSAVVTAVEGATVWKKLPESERQPYVEMAIPYQSKFRSRSKSRSRQRGVRIRKASKRRATSRTRGPAAKRRSKSRNATGGLKRVIKRARSTTVGRSRKPATVGSARLRTVRRSYKSTSGRSRSITVRRSRKTMNVCNPKPVRRRKTASGAKSTRRSRSKTVQYGRRRRTSQSRSRRTATQPRGPRRKTTRKSDTSVVKCEPCSALQSPSMGSCKNLAMDNKAATKTVVNFMNDGKCQFSRNEQIRSAGNAIFLDSNELHCEEQIPAVNESLAEQKLQKCFHRP